MPLAMAETKMHRLGSNLVNYRSSAYHRTTDEVFGSIRNVGRDIASLNYILYILGFFTGVTAIAAVVLAYMRRGATVGIVRSHLDWQIRIFWHGVLAFLAIGILHAVIVGLGAITFGIGLVFLVIPWTLGFAWLVWTIWAIVAGMRRLNRGLPIG